jgi:hypothetical protein
MRPEEGSIYSLDITNNGALLQKWRAPTLSDCSWVVLPYVVPYEGSHFTKFCVETWHKLQGSKFHKGKLAWWINVETFQWNMEALFIKFEAIINHRDINVYAFGKVQPTSVVWISTPTLHIVNFISFWCQTSFQHSRYVLAHNFTFPRFIVDITNFGAFYFHDATIRGEYIQAKGEWSHANV